MKGETYEDFVGKFKPKKTTDDCYTPPLIYDAVMRWACDEYGLDPDSIVRPFWPGGDYQRFDYPDGCVVLDNPPFSILSQICKFYLRRGIPFFLFAPSLTALSGHDIVMHVNHILCGSSVTYANGAVVGTGFVTSFGGDVVMQTAPGLGAAIDAAQASRATLPKYEYPDHVVTAAQMNRYAKYGVSWQIRRADCLPIAKLDAQAAYKKTIFGGGLLLSDHAAAEHAAAERSATERATAHRWSLSKREMAWIRKLSGGPRR